MTVSESTATIREAQEDDLPRLLELLFQLDQSGRVSESDLRPADEHTIAVLRSILEDRRYRLLVLEDEGEIRGSLALYVLPNLSHGASPWCVVENVIVDESMRGRRYGEALMADALRLARESGCYKVSLTSNVKRPAAHRFYERIGFHNTHKGFTLYFDSR